MRISSRDNPLLLMIRKLLADPGGYRKVAQAWIEGEHLVSACVARGHAIEHLLIAVSAWEQGRFASFAEVARKVAIVDDRWLAQLGTLESAAPVGALVALSAAPPIEAGMATVVLDRLQDAGNVGSVLRTAAAFGWMQVVALKGTVALWSPKVLRAGMGAHFALRLVDSASSDVLDQLQLPLVATSSHAAESVAQARWPSPCAWVFGHEGQGVASDLLARCAQTVRIPQPGGGESLNVAAAAAVCLYEDLRRRAGSVN